jgi:hypothetical protein
LNAENTQEQQQAMMGQPLPVEEVMQPAQWVFFHSI